MAGKGWVFASQEELLIAMRSGQIPAAVQSKPVRYWTTADGEIGVQPKTTPRAMSAALKAAGVSRIEAPTALHDARVWPAIFPANESAKGDVEPVVLFVMEETRLLSVLGELLRLGCDRASYQVLHTDSNHLAVVRAYDPPYYSVALASDPRSPHRVFVPATSGQEQLWIERGYTHPALLGVVPAADGLELICADKEWLGLPSGDWTDVLDIVDLQMPAPGVLYKPTTHRERLTVDLSFSTKNNSESSSLWVVEKEGPRILEELLQTVPNDIIGGLLFALVQGDDKTAEPCLLLRKRPGRKTVQIALEQEGYVPLMGIGNLYVPASAGLEPPLRRNTLRELLSPDSARVYWISAKPDGDLTHQSIAESDFSPLEDWADYVIHSSSEILQSWVRSSTFAFESFVSIGREWDEAPPAKAEPKNKPSKKTLPARSKEVEVQVQVQAPQSKPRTTSEANWQVEPIALGDDELALAECERNFLSLGSVGDAPDRMLLWREMAILHGRLGNSSDSALCWVRLLWAAEEKDAIEFVQCWITTEEESFGVLSDKTIGPKQSRLVAATLIQSALRKEKLAKPLANRLTSHMDEHGFQLDIRTLWLARVSMSSMAGGDSLLLARTRDTLLRRLRKGLSISNDVPTFLRFAGSHGADREAVAQLSKNLESLWAYYQKTSRKRSVVEAPETKTGALVGLLVAFGFACLGRIEHAKELRDRCLKSFGATDSVEEFLSGAYAARVAQALAGEPRTAPLPPKVAGKLDSLAKLERYKVDRLRAASTILESQERLDPMKAFQRGGDSRGEEFDGLRGLEDPVKIVLALRTILDSASQESTSQEDQIRLLDGAMDFLTLISEADAVPVLHRVLEMTTTVAPVPRVLILADAMKLAGYFGRDQMTSEIGSQLGDLINEMNADDACQLASEFGGCLQDMRRVGLSDEAATLLETLAEKSGGETSDKIEASLHVATGLFFVGNFEQAQEILQSAQSALRTLNLTSKDRLRISRAMANAWSHAPRDEATSGLQELFKQLPSITDSFNTNSHFCLTVVSFMDAMVLAIAGSDLAMGDLGRRWLDEDESIVRRRIHKDMRAIR